MPRCRSVGEPLAGRLTLLRRAFAQGHLIDFAWRRQRQVGFDPDVLGRFVRLERGRAMGADMIRVRLRTEGDIGNDRFVGPVILPRNCTGLRDRRMGDQDLFHFAWKDILAFVENYVFLAVRDGEKPIAIQCADIVGADPPIARMAAVFSGLSV